MKRILLIGALLTSVSAFAYMGSHDSMRMMADELELTPAQKSKLTEIRKESRDERLKLMDQMDALREKTREQMMAVLDKEQQARYKALRSTMRQARKAKCGAQSGMSKPQPKCDR